jgi:hypothetical protein
LAAAAGEATHIDGYGKKDEHANKTQLRLYYLREPKGPDCAFRSWRVREDPAKPSLGRGREKQSRRANYNVFRVLEISRS